MLTFNPHIPLALWCPLAVVAAALLGWYAVGSRYRLPRGRWLVVLTLMSVAVAVPLVILLNPMWVQRVPPPPGKPLLTVLIDRSASMATGDGPSGETRFQAAARFAERVSTELADRYEVRLRTFAEDTSLVMPEQLGGVTPDVMVTDVSAAVDESIEDDRPQGQAILILSDGVDTSAGGKVRLRESADRAKAVDAPLLTKTVGSQQSVNDLEIGLDLAQELAFVGQTVPVAVRLRQSGRFAQRTELTVSLDGETVEQRTVDLVADGETSVVVPLTQPNSGLYRYEIRAEAFSEEVTDQNNATTLLVRVVDEPVRVLLLEGKPYWDTKFLLRTLAADASIELVSLVQMAPGRFVERRIERSRAQPDEAAPPAADASETGSDSPTGDAQPPPGDSPPQESAQPLTDNPTGNSDQPSPVAGGSQSQSQSQSWLIHKSSDELLLQPDVLSSFQIVVLGRSTEPFLSDEVLMRLRKWLQAGDGSLVCFRGPPAAQINERLGALMPVRWSPGRESRFRVQLTDSGRSLRWLPEAADLDQDVLAQLPSLAASARPEKPKPLTKVLATNAGGQDDAIPLVTYRPEGNGRVVVIEGAGMWRWAFLPPQHQQHDEVYGSLWKSLTRWLVANVGLLPSQQLSLRTDSVTFRTTEPASATLLVREEEVDEVPQIELAGDGLDQPRTIQPVPLGELGGIYRVGFGRLPAGRYTARVKGDTSGDAAALTMFDIADNLKERLETVSRPDVMRELARRSGGAELTGDDPQELADRFAEHLARSRPDRVTRSAAWDRWWILLGAFALWATTWGLRRWSGLI